MSTGHIFELTWTQLYDALHDDTSRETLIKLFNSCEPTEDAITIKVRSSTGGKAIFSNRCDTFRYDDGELNMVMASSVVPILRIYCSSCGPYHSRAYAR